VINRLGSAQAKKKKEGKKGEASGLLKRLKTPSARQRRPPSSRARSSCSGDQLAIALATLSQEGFRHKAGRRLIVASVCRIGFRARRNVQAGLTGHVFPPGSGSPRRQRAPSRKVFTAARPPAPPAARPSKAAEAEASCRYGRRWQADQQPRPGCKQRSDPVSLAGMICPITPDPPWNRRHQAPQDRAGIIESQKATQPDDREGAA